MRAAKIDENGYVLNVILVPYLDFMPGLIAAEESGAPGDWWSGTEFIRPQDPRFPPRPVSP